MVCIRRTIDTVHRSKQHYWPGASIRCCSLFCYVFTTTVRSVQVIRSSTSASYTSQALSSVLGNAARATTTAMQNDPHPEGISCCYLCTFAQHHSTAHYHWMSLFGAHQMLLQNDCTANRSRGDVPNRDVVNTCPLDYRMLLLCHRCHKLTENRNLVGSR